MSAADDWFLLDEAGGEVLILMPDRRMVRGKVVGTLGKPEPSAGVFNPAAWLDAYAAEGGSYAVTSDGALWLGIIGFVGEDLAKHTAPLRGRPDREEAIKVLIRERSLIA